MKFSGFPVTSVTLIGYLLTRSELSPSCFTPVRVSVTSALKSRFFSLYESSTLKLKVLSISLLVKRRSPVPSIYRKENQVKKINVCDPTPANEALCGKFKFKLRAYMCKEAKMVIMIQQSGPKVLDHSDVFISDFPCSPFSMSLHTTLAQTQGVRRGNSILRQEFEITIPSHIGQKAYL